MGFLNILNPQKTPHGAVLAGREKVWAFIAFA